MSYFENDENIEVTSEMLDNFASSSNDYLDEDIKTLDEIREERLAKQEERRLRKKQERRSKLLNNLMPTAALALLICTVYYLNSLQFGLVISYNDEQIATVENADVVEEATDIINNKIILKSLDSLETEPQYTVAVINNDSEMQNSTELSRAILANDNVLEDEICGVFVDGTFVGATLNQDEAEAVLQEILNEEKANSKDLGEVQSVDFNNNVSLQVGLYARSSVVDGDTLKERLLNNVELSYKTIVLQEQNVKIKYKTEYVVDDSKPSGYEKVTTEGVIGEGIASNLVTYIDGIKVNSERDKITATKRPVSEVITISSDHENAGTAKHLDSDTDTASDTDSKKASEKTTDSDTDKTADTKSAESTSSAAEDKSSDTSTDTSTDTDTSASSASTKSQSSSFIWPAPSCTVITNEFGYQGEKLHKGIDISGSSVEGQPILAAASGYVTTVVIDYGTENYGCYLIIDHGNGYQTLYAQCSDIYVAPGTYVEQGETVAAVGSTGNATGPHLHFEIIENGEYVNPTNYLY